VSSNWLRRTPLFVRVALPWWLVLLAYPPTRPYLLYQSPLLDRSPREPLVLTGPALLLAALSLLHTLVAAWIVVRVLSRYDARRALFGLLSWTVFVAWFAVASWCLVILVATNGLEAWKPGFLIAALFTFPWLAFSLLWKATWIFVPLALATVLLVRRHLPAPSAPPVAAPT
jgi:hypothetical protein